jgi:cysteine desulfurase/selenocysteine lyase
MWRPTMTTSSLPFPDLEPDLGPQAGLPSVAQLQALANEIFQKVPGSPTPSAAQAPQAAVPSVPGGVPASAPSFAGAPTPGVPGSVGFPTPNEPSVAGIPSSLSPSLVGATNPTEPGVPGVPTSVKPSLVQAPNPAVANPNSGGRPAPVVEAYPGAGQGPVSAPPFATPAVPTTPPPAEGIGAAPTFGLSLSFLDHPAAAPVVAHPQVIPFEVAAPAVLPTETQYDSVPRIFGNLDGETGSPAPRKDFPILNETVNGKKLIWFDNAATTQKPRQVIDRISYFYEHENSNIHRAAHELAARSTDAYEEARHRAQRFVNAASPDEIIFVRGATEGINLLANTLGTARVGEGDEILISWLEHHANIVPWQQLAARVGARLVVAPVDDSGQIIVSEFARLITPKTKIVSFTVVSNALGTVTPVAELVHIAHSRGAVVVVDGAQSVSHLRTDVQAIDADFFVFSGHKVYGPTGIGVVYGKKALLEELPPWQGGGNMIADVTFERTQYHGAPTRFEAGTGNIADAVGLGEALEYVSKIGLERIAAHEHALLHRATEGLIRIPGLTIIGTAAEKAGLVSFVVDGFAPDEIGRALNAEGIAVRSGHHCAQPILRRFGQEATVRPSFGAYNTIDEVDELVRVVTSVVGRRY